VDSEDSYDTFFTKDFASSKWLCNAFNKAKKRCNKEELTEKNDLL